MVEQSKKSPPLKLQYLFTTRLGETTKKIWTLTEDSAYLLTYLMGRKFVLFTIYLLIIFKREYFEKNFKLQSLIIVLIFINMELEIV